MTGSFPGKRVMKIDQNHPRAISLNIREKLEKGVKKGITSAGGLIAHGRGEAFDYLLSEKTHPFALQAIRAAAAYLLSAKRPVLSINGNSMALGGYEFIKIARLLDCMIEVNLFDYSEKRRKIIESDLIKLDATRVLAARGREKIIIPEIASKRAIVMREGIGSSDCVLVPLEDGDRCRALIKMGKKVITVDLNPLSRTAKYATVTIIDNITRCLPLLFRQIRQLKKKDKKMTSEIIKNYQNKKILEAGLKAIYAKLK